MKKNLKTIFMLCFFTLFITTSCSSDDNSTDSNNNDQGNEDDDDDNDEPVATVNFVDERLALQVKLTLGLDENESVTVENILELEELNIDGDGDLSPNGDIREIANLGGLEHAKNLTYLHLGNTQVTDLSPISGLEKMDYLRLNNTAVTDLSPISNYTTLTYFNANTTEGITDISPLAGNTGIKEIILRNVPFGNEGMATLANFTVMYRLNMRATEVTDITVLGQLMAAGALLDSTPGAAENGGGTLDVRGLSVDDWSPIEPYVDQISNLDGYPGN